MCSRKCIPMPSYSSTSSPTFHRKDRMKSQARFDFNSINSRENALTLSAEKGPYEPTHFKRADPFHTTIYGEPQASPQSSPTRVLFHTCYSVCKLHILQTFKHSLLYGTSILSWRSCADAVRLSDTIQSIASAESRTS